MQSTTGLRRFGSISYTALTAQTHGPQLLVARDGLFRRRLVKNFCADRFSHAVS